VGARTNRPPVVVLSGPVGAGKTTLAEALVAKLGFERLLTRDAILRRLPDTPRARNELQAAGEALDRDSGGQWVADELATLMSRDRSVPGFVVDAVLIPEQIEAVRQRTPGQVLHAHLTAPQHELEARYRRKRGDIEEADSYSMLLGNATEANVHRLSEHADLEFDTSITPIQQEVDQIVRRLDLAEA
jgi:adenylosuccinate synthase